MMIMMVVAAMAAACIDYTERWLMKEGGRRHTHGRRRKL